MVKNATNFHLIIAAGVVRLFQPLLLLLARGSTNLQDVTSVGAGSSETVW